MPRPIQQLEESLRRAMAESARGISEKEALEAALGVADEWKMRLDEIEAEESDEE
jgi:succinate dehydrogenase/fumarate reductase flavoprotein subunit